MFDATNGRRSGSDCSSAVVRIKDLVSFTSTTSVRCIAYPWRTTPFSVPADVRSELAVACQNYRAPLAPETGRNPAR